MPHGRTLSTGEVMTPKQFVEKWAKPPLRERQIAQAHFLDVCRLVGVEMPGAGKTETGEEFVFEPSIKTASGHGFADVYYEGHFGGEYKTPDKYRDLNTAYAQLQRYRENLKNPPLLFVPTSTTGRSTPISPIYGMPSASIALSTPRSLQIQKSWTGCAPCSTRPNACTPDAIPSKSQRKRRKRFVSSPTICAIGTPSWTMTRIAYFLTKLVFCLFAEDVGLLPTASSDSPQGIFSHIIAESRGKASVFQAVRPESLRRHERRRRAAHARYPLLQRHALQCRNR